jgi:hypothetical protein
MAVIPYVIATTGFDYTPHAVQPLSFVAVQPHKMKRMAEGVDFKWGANRLIACCFQLRYFLGLQATLQGPPASWRGQHLLSIMRA